MIDRHRGRAVVLIVCWLVASTLNHPLLAAPSACVPFPLRDDAARRQDFVEFRRNLLAAIERRDIDAVVDVAAPDIRLSFGTSNGREDLRQELKADAGRWDALRELLTLGGTWESPNVFTAPYVFSAWPDGHDSFEERAIVGARVNVRAAPKGDAAVLASLSYCIVRVATTRDQSDDWIPTELGPTRIGYVSARHARSPIDYRASFEFKNKRWRMTYFVAGD